MFYFMNVLDVINTLRLLRFDELSVALLLHSFFPVYYGGHGVMSVTLVTKII